MAGGITRMNDTRTAKVKNTGDTLGLILTLIRTAYKPAIAPTLTTPTPKIMASELAVRLILVRKADNIPRYGSRIRTTTALGRKIVWTKKGPTNGTTPASNVVTKPTENDNAISGKNLRRTSKSPCNKLVFPPRQFSQVTTQTPATARP